MKILFAGSWNFSQYEKSFAEALQELGHELIPFSFSDFFKGSFLGHYQNALPLPGPALWQLNNALLKKVRTSNPNVIFVWRGTHILPYCLKLIKETGVLAVSYNHDDPFGPHAHGRTPWHHHILWFWYLRCLKEFDINFVCRKINIEEAMSLGAKNAHILKQYFVPSKHRPLELSDSEKQRFNCDVVFAGHYEPDGRIEYIRALIRAGFHVHLFGGKYWTKEVIGDLASYFGDVSPVEGEDYAKALCGARICLAFLSKMNRDNYTTRCFEIPACGRLLMCERTDDLKEMFNEGEEAVFFSSKEELVEKVMWLIKKPDEIVRIAEAGRKRVWEDGHDVLSRAKQFTKALGDCKRQ